MKDLNKEIYSIIESRLFRAPPSLKKYFPKSVADGSGFHLSFGNDKLHLIVFLDSSEKNPLEERIKKGYDPFPGLFTVEQGIGAAFRFESSKNCVIESCVIKNSYALSLGKDSAIVIVDHTQEVNTKDLGIVKYRIDLGFIITFPNDSIPFDLADSFDDLITYYISTRRKKK